MTCRSRGAGVGATWTTLRRLLRGASQPGHRTRAGAARARACV